MDNSIESQIISTVHHLKSLITMYVLLEFSTPLEPYYSDLCNKLEKLARIIESERNKQNDRKRETDCK